VLKDFLVVEKDEIYRVKVIRFGQNQNLTSQKIHKDVFYVVVNRLNETAFKLLSS